jgi:tetratricopeptide (TPR) repeat protein
MRPLWGHWTLMLLISGLLISLCVLMARKWGGPPLPDGVLQKDFDKAAADFRAQFNRDGDHFDVLMWLAKTATRKEDFSTALACYEQVPLDHIRYGASARYEEAKLLAQTDHVRRAEDSFRKYLSLIEKGIRLSDRDVAHSRHWLSLILGVQLRQEERRIILQELMQDHQADINDVKQYYFESLLIWQTSFGSGRVRDFLKKDPGNRHLRIAAARYLVGEGSLSEAREQLLQLRSEDADDLRALSVLLECCHSMNDWSAFAREFASVPAFSPDEPWLLTQFRGEWALHEKNWGDAEKYFQYLLDVDPVNTMCLMGLARTFGDQGKIGERDAVLQRALVAAKLRVDLAALNHDNPKAARLVASSARTLGMEDAAVLLEFLATRMPNGTP